MNIDLASKDEHARRRALDIKHSFIVQAPAGSGKTELLIQRFLTLLAHVQKPEEILAITFTKKAANEMRMRVIKALQQAMHEDMPSSSHAKQTWTLAKCALQRDQQLQWNLIANPNQLHIYTIDALCVELTQQLPLLSHFGCKPKIADNALLLYRAAVQEVLSHVEENLPWSNAIERLLEHLDNDLNKLFNLLVILLAKRDQWLPYLHLETNPEQIKKQLENDLAQLIETHLQHVATLFPHDAALEVCAIARFAADQLALQHKQSPLLACRFLTSLPTPYNKEAWLGIATLLLTKQFAWRKKISDDVGFFSTKRLLNSEEKKIMASYRERFMALINQLKSYENLREAIAEIFFLPNPVYSTSQWEILTALLRVLKIAAAQLSIAFQQNQCIDFIENMQAALRALGENDAPTDLSLALDYQIQHILVDEFQDTAFSQFQLLEKLTWGWQRDDGRTLFVVGDPMQSIYRFRNAEVGLFLRMQQHGIGAISLKPLTLAANFRSAKKIVNFNNEIFTAVFPTVSNVGTGAITFSCSETQLATTENNIVSINGFIDTYDAFQAEQVVAKIKETLKQYPDESIALLVRSRSHLAAIMPALKQANILYHAVEIDALASRQCIQDLLSLTCALLHLADRIAWLAILRAPWCGLTLQDLQIIADNPSAIIWERMNNIRVQNALTDDGKHRLNKFITIIKNQLAERERQNLRMWIESTWIGLGGPACLHDKHDENDVQAYFELLTKYNQDNNILNIDVIKESTQSLFATLRQAHCQVYIMTIHSAKGLEFDTVILPHLEKKISHEDKSLLQWMETPLSSQRMALLLAPIHATGAVKDKLYEYIHRQQKMKAAYETDRLLYVAATRAKKRLHLFFNIDKTSSDEYRVKPGSFLEKMWPHFEKQDIKLTKENNVLVDVQTSSVARMLQRLDSTWQHPLNFPTTQIVSMHHQKSGFRLSSAEPQLIGSTVHKVLQLISEQQLTWWLYHPTKEKKDYLIHQLRQLGMPPKQVQSAVLKCYQMIENTLNDKRGKWILKSHLEAKSEYALTAQINGKFENLIIDRTFVAEGTRWIIDYKTTALDKNDLENFLHHEQQKYLAKMQKYAHAIQHVDQRPIKLGLYFPALPAWHEWDWKSYQLIFNKAYYTGED